MNSTQKTYDDFKCLYGKLLFPHGFVFKNHTFYRRHADDVLLEVSIALRYPYFDVTFAAYPFSCAYNAAKGWRGWGVDWFMANLSKRVGQICKRQLHDFGEEKMKRGYLVFSTIIFPEFNKVISLETYRTYNEWFTTSIGLSTDTASNIWVCLQQKDYSNAKKYIHEHLRNNAYRYAKETTSSDNSSYIKECNFWMKISNDIDDMNFEEIDKYVKNRINITKKTCEKLKIISK